jgi:hypothetical protein
VPPDHRAHEGVDEDQQRELPEVFAQTQTHGGIGWLPRG